MLRPHLEYCVQFCLPDLRNDLAAMEQVQHRDTRSILRLGLLSYETRLKEMRLYIGKEMIARDV